MSCVLAAGRLAKTADSIEPNHTCVCHTPPCRPHCTSRLARGEGESDRELQMDSVALYSEGKVMTPHCFLEFKSTSFSINIFFNRIFLLFFKNIKTIPISSNTRLYILTRFSQAFFGYL